MNRMLLVGTATICMTLGQLFAAVPARCDGRNRTAVALDAKTFITVKDVAEWEYVHLYTLENGKLVLVDSVAVRQDHKVDRLIEFRRLAIEGNAE
jgi:ligand-binding SRPBCC domain-containing protein